MKDKKEEISFATRMKKAHKESLEKRVANMTSDAYRDARLAAQICKVCYYSGPSLAGQAFTKRDCGFCQKTETYPNTSTDALCMDCAKDNDCCKHCKSELDY